MSHSPRVTPQSIVEDIRSTINNIIKDRYDNFKIGKSYSFQSTQNLRDQLGDLVKQTSAIVAAGNLLPKTLFPADYRHIVSTSIRVDGKDYWAVPTTYDELRTLEVDPFSQPTIEIPAQVYYTEQDLGLVVHWGTEGVLQSGYFYYIKHPAQVNYGTEYDSTHTFVVGNIVIAIEITVYNGVTYQIGQEITIVAGFLTITSGTVVIGYTNTDLPLLLHEEIALSAAQLGINITENYNKGTILERQNEKV
ncbi:MAG: hypothetical protein WC479_07085 [Candidatus Izemoplasmatales bacterium]